MKSPAAEAATRPLQRLESDRREDFRKATDAHGTERTAFEINLKAAKSLAEKRARAGGDARDCPMPEEPEEPVERRLLVNAATPEKLVAIHAANPRGLLVLRDELLGWLRGMDRQGRESERALFLEGWTGKNPFRTDTIGRGSDFVAAACLSVFGGIQPGPFREFLQSPEEAAKADGLLQRFSVLVWPEPTPFSLNDNPPDLDAAHRAETALRRLATLNEDALETGTAPEHECEPPFLRFTPDAQAAFLEWLVAFMNRLATVTPEPFQGHLSKYRKTLPALALICELADNPTAAAVSLESWQRAEGWGLYLESHARKVYGAGIYPDRAGAAAVLEHLRTGTMGEEFSTRDVYLRGWSGLTELTAIRAALGLLAEHGFIRPKASEPGPGRPSERWEIHPSIFGEGTEANAA